ncbi:MICOS complex subunit Mic10-like [Pectinophora gossypiella]|uniref:MICOS complex subunit Mic10-like n=1 Tax=Pectinophora gossypiella TaxID=13191 RepID=UPI00214F233B|nr:MICOS complex subunit Mic10-like [Pectinophora gossypiella]
MSKPDARNFEERYRACFIDFGLKIGSGLLLGSMFGSFFLRGYKKWPMFIGGGLGFGMAYGNCENSLNDYLMALDPKLCEVKLVFVL